MNEVGVHEEVSSTQQLVTPPEEVIETYTNSGREYQQKYLKYAENVPRDYQLPQELHWVGYYISRQLEILKKQPAYFHGTRVSRLAGILESGGLKAFAEKDMDEETASISATPDPVIAAHHAYHFGAFDTFRDYEKQEDPSDPVVILKINFDALSSLYNKFQIPNFKATAKRVYELLQEGNVHTLVGVDMRTKFIPIDALAIVKPLDDKGKIEELSIGEFLTNNANQTQL